MRTIVVEASESVVRTASVGLREARMAVGLDGRMWVQSPDFDALEPSALEGIAKGLAAVGVDVVVLEDQDPLPQEGR